MSKKIMKRSLALGALMAFVITGSAMAAEFVGQQYDLNSAVDNQDSVIVKVSGGVAPYKHYGVYLKSDVEGIGVLDVTSGVGGVIAYGSYDINAEKINIKNGTDASIYTGEGYTVNLIADEIYLEGPQVIVSNDVVNIEANNKMTLKGNIASLSDVNAIFNGAQSSFTGKVTLNGSAAKTKLALNDGATWNVTGDSVVTGLAGNNAQIKNATDGEVSVTVNNAGNYHYANTTIKDSTLKLEGVDLILNSDAGKDAANGYPKCMGMLSNASIVSDSDVTINQNGNDVALGYYSQDSIVAKNININAKGEGVWALYIIDGANDKHTLKADEKITITSYGRSVFNTNGTIDITAQEVNIKSDRSAEEKANNAITVNGSGGVNVNADKLVFTGGIDLIGTESANINLKSEDGKSTPDSIQITGNIKAETGKLTGFVVDGAESFVEGAINTGNNANAAITFSNDGTWQNNGASKVAVLTLDGGVIDQTSNTANNTNKIEVGTMSGEGVLKVADTTADQLVLTTKGDGYALKVTTDKQDVELEDLTKVAKMAAEEESAATTVAITGGSVYDEISAEVTGYGTVANVNKEVAEANIAANDMAVVGLMSWRAEMNDMNKRMGELRNANGDLGVWVRMVRGESEYNSVKNQYNQYQLGYDEKLSVDKRWTVGAAISYTDAENNFAQGNGESTNKALSIYGSKLNADGTFVDLIAKYARLENEFDIVSGMGDAEYDANGYSFSAEFGKRIQQGNGLWIEPQVELTYGKVGSAEYVTAKGVNVAQDSMESLVGRVGFSLGKDIKDGNVYARASYLYDFEGETQATLNNDAVLKQDLGGGWWEVGVGANINLSKATYIYADVEKTFGGEVDTNWQWNLGVRYSF